MGARMLTTTSSLSSCPGMGMVSHMFMGVCVSTPAGSPVQFPTAEWPRSHCFNPIAAPVTCSAANHDASCTTEIPMSMTATTSVQSRLETLPMFAARQSVVNASSLSRDVATSLATATTGSRMPFRLQPEVEQGFPPGLRQLTADDLSWGYVPCHTASQYIVLSLSLYMYTHEYST